jgi:hypothetical protein
MSQTIWRCEITEEMVSHLDSDKRKSFLNKITEEVDKLGELYRVGREYENGVLRKGWLN